MNVEEEVSSSEKSEEPEDIIPKEALSPQMVVADSSIAVTGSQNVQFGHKVTVEDVNMKTVNIGESASYLERVETVHHLDYHQHNNIDYKDLTQNIVHQQHNHFHLSATDHLQISSSISDVSDEKVMKLVEKVNHFLKSWYFKTESWIFPLPWCIDYKIYLANYYVSLSLHVSALTPVSYPTEFQICSIFQAALKFKDHQQPYRILVEGNPGFGKTMLCLKLAHDWAAGENYMKRFHLVFLISLRDFTGSLKSYVTREMYPKHENPDERWVLWKFVCQEQRRVLLILDGYDELQNSYREGINDLLSGKLLPNINFIMTSRPAGTNLLAVKGVGKIFRIEGFRDEQIKCFIRNFFANSYYPIKKNHSAHEDLYRRVIGNSKLRSLAMCPLICLLLCVLYEDEGEKLPDKLTDVYLCLIASLVRRASYRNTSGEQNEIIDLNTRNVSFSGLGNVCFSNLVHNRLYFNASELREKCDLDEILSYGLLSKGCNVPNQRLKPEDTFQLLHKTFTEFMSAFYLKDIVDDTSLLKTEMARLETLKEEDKQNILQYLVGLLKDRAFVIFDVICDSDFKPNVMFKLLDEAGYTGKNITSMCKSLNMNNLVLSSSDPELEGWCHIVAHRDCVLEYLEFQHIVNQGSLLPLQDIALRNSQQTHKFCTAFKLNTSIKYFKLSCLLHLYDLALGKGTDNFKNHISSVAEAIELCLSKPNLKEVIIDIKSIDFNDHNIILPITNALIKSLGSMVDPTVEKLVVSLPLGNKEVEAMCHVLSNLSRLKSLHLCKLSCDRDGFVVLADLLHTFSLTELVLGLDFSQLGANLFKPGSPQDLKQSITSVKKEIFRRTSKSDEDGEVQIIPQSISRVSATSHLNNLVGLITMNGKITDDKINIHIRNGIWYMTRSEQRTFSKSSDVSTRLPLPFCDQFSHMKSGFHHIFTKLRQSTLSVLDLSMCFLKPSDFVCLGECLRVNKSLRKLIVKDCKKVHDVFPILVSLYENDAIKYIDLSSKTIVLDHFLCEMLLKILITNSHLVSLVLQGWSFHLADNSTWEKFHPKLSLVSLEELDLTNCQMFVDKADEICCLAPENVFQYSLKSINLDSLVIYHSAIKKPIPRVSVVQNLRYFSNLSVLDISGSAEPSRTVVMEDVELVSIFSILSKFAKNLKTLKMCHWEINITNEEKTCRMIGDSLRSGGKLVNFYMDYLKINSQNKSSRKLLLCIIKSTKKLQTLSFIKHSLSVEDGIAMGLAIKDKWIGSQLTVYVKLNSLEAVECLMKTVAASSKLVCTFKGGPRGEVDISLKTDSSKHSYTNPFRQLFMKVR